MPEYSSMTDWGLLPATRVSVLVGIPEAVDRAGRTESWSRLSSSGPIRRGRSPRADGVDGGGFAGADDRWTKINGARRIWIQGDLHAENFGTYLDAGGRLVFDVNDFDEAYLGHLDDAMRFCASLALLCRQRRCPTRPSTSCSTATCVLIWGGCSTTSRLRMTPSGR